jgi:ATP-binding protein involved in chromosome partitioning
MQKDALNMTDQPSSTNDSARISAGKSCGSCSDPCAASRRRPEESDRDFADRQKIEARLCRIRRKVVVLSGKGGVGKSTVAVNLAVALALAGKRTGLLDVDLHGPSVPTMLGLEGKIPSSTGQEFVPVDAEGLSVMSLGFLLASPDDAVIWRGPLKMGVIRQFLADVAWGDLDFLVVDSPPGTGDEPLSLCQLIGTVDGAVVVTTPQKVAAVDVRKCVTFCRQLKVPVLGVIENMASFVCPKCGEITPIFRSGGGRALAEDMGVPFLGSIPIDPLLAESGDRGRPFIRDYADTPTAGIMREIIRPIVELEAK